MCVAWLVIRVQGLVEHVIDYIHINTKMESSNVVMMSYGCCSRLHLCTYLHEIISAFEVPTVWVMLEENGCVVNVVRYDFFFFN